LKCWCVGGSVNWWVGVWWVDREAGWWVGGSVDLVGWWDGGLIARVEAEGNDSST
jgi:hypothetical protein